MKDGVHADAALRTSVSSTGLAAPESDCTKQPSAVQPTKPSPTNSRRSVAGTKAHFVSSSIPGPVTVVGMLCAAMLSLGLAWIFVEGPCLRRWPGKGEGAAENHCRPKAQCLSRVPYTAFESPSRHQDGSLLLHQAKHLAEWFATSSPTQWHKKPLTCHPICCCGCACLPLQHLAHLEASLEKLARHRFTGA